MTRNLKSLSAAAAAALILIVATVAVRQGETKATASEQLGRLFPELMASVNDIAAITVTDAEGSYTVSTRDGVWGLVQKAYYPAKMETVRKTILAAAELQKIEAKTDVPARYTRLGVEDVDSEGANSTLLVLADGSGAKLAELLVGNRRQGGGAASTYVRIPGQARSWLAEGDLSLPLDAAAWLDKAILKVERDAVQAVELAHADGEHLSVSKGSRDDENYEVHGIPAEHELKYASVANGLCGALEYLNLQDVLPAEGFEGSEEPTVATFWTFEGLRVDATVHTVDEKHFATFQASFDEEGPAAVASMGPLPVSEEGNDDGQADASALDPEGAAATATELNERLGPWVYEIALYNQTNFTKRMTDMVKPVEPPAAPEPAVEDETLPEEKTLTDTVLQDWEVIEEEVAEEELPAEAIVPDEAIVEEEPTVEDEISETPSADDSDGS